MIHTVIFKATSQNYSKILDAARRKILRDMLYNCHKAGDAVLWMEPTKVQCDDWDGLQVPPFYEKWQIMVIQGSLDVSECDLGDILHFPKSDLTDDGLFIDSSGYPEMNGIPFRFVDLHEQIPALSPKTWWERI